MGKKNDIKKEAHEIKDKILTKIRSGDLEMRSRAHFILRSTLFGAVFVLTVVLLLFLIFLSFFAVAFLNHMLQSQYLGFLIMAFIYLILGLFIYVYRENLIFGRVFREFFKDNTDTESDTETDTGKQE